MGEKLVIGPIDKGLRTDRTAFNIDNDSFPTLINAYQWRGRVKRKRGTALLNRLTRAFSSGSTTITLSSGAGNILTGFSLQSTASIIPGSVTIVDTTASVTYTDPGAAGVLVGSPSGSGTINYATGAITITGGASDIVTAAFNYYPGLPVMGLEDLYISTSAFPGTLAFDTTYSYNINTASPYNSHDVSFYKNPASGTYPSYVQKSTDTATTWNGQSYQQFWTCNYQRALWATNGINVPFSTANIGMQFKLITGISITSGGPPAIVVLTIASSGLVAGDFIFINEVVGNTGINFQTGYVTNVTGSSVTVELPNATIGGSYSSGGIAQYLTNRANTTIDCLRWYDGDPTTTNNGWVNFAPPLSQLGYTIADAPSAQYYLVGARLILPFKDRLLFFGPVIQTSAAGSQVYLQDTVIYSQNGTPYYTASFTGVVTSAATVFNPILVPTNQTATPNSFWEDQTGFGGFISAGVDIPILTASPNEDVLIIGFATKQARFVYTGNDLVPFNFFIINSELGSQSTFSSVTLDRGVISVGNHGIIITAQVGAQRIDLNIPDQIFEFNLTNNGPQRICAQRDFVNEWIYFTYLSNQSNYLYPNQTLQYNYRDESWAIFNESYTTYGTFRKSTGYTWATIGNVYPTWAAWDEPWYAGSSTLLQPQVIGGNQQGFVLTRDEGTAEGNSLYIQGFSASVVTSPAHGLNTNDYIVISGCLGTVGTQVNGKIFRITSLTANTFSIDPSISGGTYLGGGLIQRMYIPYIQTKQFPVAWEMARKTRLGAQQYLFTTTSNGRITLLIFLSQNASSPYNAETGLDPGPIVPSPNSFNNSLIYSTVLYTCPESTNLGLTPANINLQIPTSQQQSQTWHRMNTSLIGDTVQIGFTLSDAQMRDVNFYNQFAEIEFHSAILDLQPSQLLV